MILASSPNSLPHKLAQRLSKTGARIRTEWDTRPAAVLVPLIHRDSEWHLLFTRRTDIVNDHRGQVSFPGGVIEPGDKSPEAAALREAQEEIGLPPDRVDIIGRLDPLLTVTQFFITPVVGVIDGPVDLKINDQEVAAIFDIPVDWLLDDANVEIKPRESPYSDRPIPVIYFKPYRGEVVWGATARMTSQLLELIHETGALA